MILLVDNYDSFTYNIAQAIETMGHRLVVVRNDAATLDEIETLSPEAIVISPGPGRPEDAGFCIDLVRRFAGRSPILGVCLGHQCIVTAFGGRIVRADRVMHGKASPIYHDGKGVYEGLSNPFVGGRYHSLVAEEASLPRELEVAAYTADGEIMGVRLPGAQLEGVQFHPESIMTPEGRMLLNNFVRMAKGSEGGGERATGSAG